MNREDFPNLDVEVNGKKIVYFDNAATTFKPQVVIDAVNNHYSTETSNVHRGVHSLSAKASEKYEDARRVIQKFISAEHEEEIIFTKGTTDSINLVSYGLRELLNSKDEVIVTEMEHHSNLVPWQLLCERTGAKLKIVPINESGELDLAEYKKLLSKKTKIVAVVHISNSLGTINPIKEMIKDAHKFGAEVLIDGAQAVAHMNVDVKDLDCDYYAFSGHKMHGPTGVGVLYGKKEILENLPVFEVGGGSIKSVTLEKTIYADLPAKFEAGTPNIAGVIGLAVAAEYLMELRSKIFNHTQELLKYATSKLNKIEGLKIIGTAKNKSGIISFHLPDVHAHDIGTLADNDGIAIRTGHHCTQPVMKRFGIAATSRASFAMYNTKEEIDKLIMSLKNIKKVFKWMTIYIKK